MILVHEAATADHVSAEARGHPPYAAENGPGVAMVRLSGGVDQRPVNPDDDPIPDPNMQDMQADMSKSEQTKRGIARRRSKWSG